MQKRVWLIVVMIVVLIASMALAVACDTKDKDPIDDGGSSIIDDGGNNGGDNSDTSSIVDVSQYLTYQLNEDEQSYMVTGLTQEGYSLVKMIDNGESIRNTVKCKLTIPSQYQGKPVVRIAPYVFGSCSGLTDVVIPNSISSIGDWAFAGCYGLTRITIQDNVTSIGELAFANCFSLIEVYNKSSLNIVAGSSDYGNVAYYAKNVFTQEGGSKLSVDQDGYVIYTDEEDNILVKYMGVDTNLTLPSGITKIHQGAFFYDMEISNVVIPDSVTSIEDMAFAGCIGLQGITMPDSITSIVENAFIACSSLTAINYQGAKVQWYAIDKMKLWDNGTGNYVIHCTDGDIAKE